MPDDLSFLGEYEIVRDENNQLVMRLKPVPPELPTMHVVVERRFHKHRLFRWLDAVLTQKS